MLKVGIVGGIGSGKSYVANVFHQRYGIPVYNSDIRAKQLMSLELKPEIISSFGEDSFINGEINKEKFNKILFEDKEKLKLMNSIITPAIDKDFNNFCQQQSSNTPYVLKESAILLDTGTKHGLDKIICVVADMEIRLQRVLKRDNMSPELFWKKVENQSTDQEKIAKSDFIISNDNRLYQQIQHIHKILLYLE